MLDDETGTLSIEKACLFWMSQTSVYEPPALLEDAELVIACEDAAPALPVRLKERMTVGLW